MKLFSCSVLIRLDYERASIYVLSLLNRRKALNYQVIKHNKAGLRHRSVRALLTHTAPTSSQRVKRRDG